VLGLALLGAAPAFAQGSTAPPALVAQAPVVPASTATPAPATPPAAAPSAPRPLPPSAATPPPPQPTVLLLTPPKEDQPVTEKWGFWTAIGGVVVLTAVVVLVAARPDGEPKTTLHDMEAFRR
jgi:hypothetical protein